MSFLTELQTITGAIDGLDSSLTLFLSEVEQYIMGLMIVAAVIGVVIGFLGLKIMRLLSALCGLGVGGTIGTVVIILLGDSVQLSNTALLAIVAVCAIVAAVLLAVFQRAGAFFITFLYMISGLLSIVPLDIWFVGIAIIVVALIGAILAILFVDPLVIISTALAGGIYAGTAVAALLGMQGSNFSYIFSAVFVIAGMIVQFLMQSRKIGKKEAVYTKKHKEEESMELEVEKARMIFGDDAAPEEDEADFDNEDIDIQEIDI